MLYPYLFLEPEPPVCIYDRGSWLSDQAIWKAIFLEIQKGYLVHRVLIFAFGDL